MLKTLVKASALTNLTDARYFAALEAKWLGFCLDPDSPDFVPFAQVKSIGEWVDSVALVGEFGGQDLSYIIQATEALQLDAIQLSQPLAVEDLLKLPRVPIIQELTPSHDITSGELRAQLMAYGPHISYFLLDFTRHALSWEEVKEKDAPLPVGLLRSFCNEYPILLAFDWTPANLEEILYHIDPSGISIKGGAEEKVGVKSFEEIDGLLEILEIDD